MTEPLSAELYRTEPGDPQFRSIILTVGGDGAVQVSGQDMGPLVEQIWGDSDYEFWIDVGPAAAAQLSFELLKERYKGRPDAFERFKADLMAFGIDYTFSSWA